MFKVISNKPDYTYIVGVAEETICKDDYVMINLDTGTVRKYRHE